MKPPFIKFFWTLLIPLFCSIANAADLTIFGLSLGGEFNTPECRKILTANTAVYANSTETVCFQRGRIKESTPIVNDNKNVQVDQVYLQFPNSAKPQIMAGERIYAVVVNRNLEGIIFETQGASTSELVMNELKAKYNSPSLVTPIQVQRGKNKIDAFRAEWNLPDLSVSFQNMNFGLETGVVYILTEKGNKWYNEQMKRLKIIV